MDNKSVNSSTKKLKENAETISTPSEDHGENGTLRQVSTPIKIKEEQITDEIQEYAAVTMSELLGWYGYNKVDSDCTRSLNLDHFSSGPRTKNTRILEMKPNFHSNEEIPKSPLSFNASNLPSSYRNISLQYSTNNLISTREQIPSSSAVSLKKVTVDFTNNFSRSICSGDNRFCAWCGRINETFESGRTNSPSCNSINTLGHFCSEACLAAGRRAVFKRAKTCDWCSHIKNPISYVDFQDGESQLEFCSDKCLNQYKMNIFCHETQTHLMLHGLNTVSYHDTEKSNLITPELWFRNCQSPVADSSTESPFATDEHTTSDLSSHDKSKKNEENEIEDSLESTRRTIKKRDSFCIELCSKATSYNRNRKNVDTGINENDINGQNMKQFSVNEDNKFCNFLDNQNHCILNCPQQSTVNCNNFAKNSSLINVINCDSHSHEHNNPLFKNNIYVKDIRVLQEERKDTLTENIVCTPHLFVDTSGCRIGHDTTSSPKCLADKFNRAKYKKQINHSSRTSPSVQSNRADSSGHALSSSILSPVTVLVPYPIPVPIPIPIPVPIPTPILNKLVVGEQNIPTNTIDPEYKNLKCNRSIENKCSMLQESQLCRNANIFVSDQPQHATSTKLCVSLTSSSINDENNDNVQSFKYSAKPPRKRKHLNENINYEHKEQQLKKRNKSIAT
ncbi:sine oculis-binding protein [Lasioglossum baleicum]|uniref:sine oculis-binding protein n=1 Tax=Lasioglossum baleicum TaxID=434251 RepID=UPI003FCE023B